MEAERHVERHLAEEEQRIALVPSQEHHVVDERRRFVLLIIMHKEHLGQPLKPDGSADHRQ